MNLYPFITTDAGVGCRTRGIAVDEVVNDGMAKRVSGINNLVRDVEKFCDMPCDPDLATAALFPLLRCGDGVVLVFPHLKGDAYWSANVDLTDTVPALDLYDHDWPIWTYSEVTPPAKFVHDLEGRRGLAVSSLVSGGCIVSGSSIRRALLFTGVRVNSFSALEDAVVLPRVNIGRNASLKGVVIDSEVNIPEGLVVGMDPELDAKRFRRTENGICLITKPMIDRLQ